QRLHASHKFETIEVRKRYRSIEDPTDVALVLLVHEHPSATAATPPIPVIGRPFRRVTNRLMFLPILSFEDGYGFSYGGRVSTKNPLGSGERLSVPLQWGGTKKAALEFERLFQAGPLTRVTSSLSVWRRENPHFLADEDRVEVKGRAERVFSRFVRLG